MVFLSRYSHYSVLLLTYLAMHDNITTIPEVADYFSISRHHLAKIAMELQRTGWIRTKRGHNGGIILARPANTVLLGELIRHTERAAIEPSPDNILPASIIGDAQDAFLQHLDLYTLDELVCKAGRHSD